MSEKKNIRKKPGQRGKAKPVVNVKEKSYEEKSSIVKELEKDLPKENNIGDKNPNGGPPKKITLAVLQKLKLCFAVGMTDEQACYFCEIGVSTLYDYQKEHTEFSEEKAILKESITMQARVNVGKSIKMGNVQDSWRWLEKKDSSFIPKLNIGGDINNKMSEEDKKVYDKILQGNKLLQGKKEMKN